MGMLARSTSAQVGQ
uniref:Uncharacterized protein n=1 Tax=Arundo donax TaxID=35708 RepID=A0A0A9AHL8_ARUDO